MNNILKDRKYLAHVLGIAGLLPFAACAVLLLLLGRQNALAGPVIEIFTSYSMIVLSFLGGIRWGYALLPAQDGETPDHPMILAWSVLPAIVAWSTVFFSRPAALAILLIAYCVQGVWDSFSAHSGSLPRWIAPLRIMLTVAAAVCHAIVFLMAAYS
ncbi:DUF3429 domain-containing protein [Salaquimonas pukyongi]|uniref:DUF3429 domain-containing protein n=1 Tax=Salaquimonas pukyongi TaxID=2712698 RepID=UPI00096B78BE|nr:DUF3429 domain-containing protein [Salaquimonas pukyongi]